MKVILKESVKGLEVGQVYKVKEVRREGKTFFYKILIPGGYQWLDKRLFKSPQPWLKGGV